MATELLQDLMERSGGLTSEERQRLARFLSEQAENGNGDERRASVPVDGEIRESVHSQKREQHMAWLKANREEYSGRYVALDGDRLMGDGRTIKEAAEQAKANGCHNPFLVYVLSSDVVANGGL